MPTLKENVDFQLIPGEDINEQSWYVRILQGDYVETVLAMGNIAVDGTTDRLTFNFRIISSPDEDLTTEDPALQEYVGDMMQTILHDAIESGSAVIREREN